MVEKKQKDEDFLMQVFGGLNIKGSLFLLDLV